MSYSRRLDNVLKQIDYVENKVNKELINEFSKYLILKDASANYQRNCIKIMLMFAEFIKEQKGLNLAQLILLKNFYYFWIVEKEVESKTPIKKTIFYNNRLLFLHLYTDFLIIDIFQNSILNTKLN